MRGKIILFSGDNQEIWDNYYALQMQIWDLENRENLKSIQWTEEEKILKSKRMQIKKSLEKITPYNYERMKKRESLAQYKTTISKFEKYIGKSFNEISGKDLEYFRKIESNVYKKNIVNSFLVFCVNNEIIHNTDKSFLVNLLPKMYRKIGELLIIDDRI